MKSLERRCLWEPWSLASFQVIVLCFSKLGSPSLATLFHNGNNFNYRELSIYLAKWSFKSLLQNVCKSRIHTETMKKTKAKTSSKMQKKKKKKTF